MAKYQIGTLILDFIPLYDTYFQDNLEHYRTKDDTLADYTIRTEIKARLTKPTSPVRTVYSTRHIHKEGTKEIVCAYNNAGRLHLKTITDNAKGETLIEIEDTKDPKKNAEKEYVLTGMRFLEAALTHKMLSLHASALEVDGEAIIFSAPSQTGKSTHARLWLRHIDKAAIINDDKPLLFEKDGQIMVTGSPWSGKDTLNTNKTVPLKAIIFLDQDHTNTVSSLTKEEKLWHLMRNIHRPGDEMLWDHLFALLEKIITRTPIHYYRCTKDKTAVSTLHNHLYGGKDL